MRLQALFLSLLFGFYAFANNPGVSYQGRIIKPDGTPLEGTSVQFRMQVRSPGSENCLLYEEVQSINMAGSSGAFALTLNDGNGTRLDTPTYQVDRIFVNRDSMILDSSRCAVGTTYTPNTGDGRKFVVYFKDETMTAYEPLPIMSLNYAPQAMYALESQKVDKFSVSNLLRAVDVSGNPVTAPALDPTQLTNLNNLLAGTSTQYATTTQFNSVQTFAKSAPPTCGPGEVLKSNGTALSCVAAGGTPTLPTTGATATNSIDSTNFGQVWNWSTATTQNPMSMTANTLTTGSLLNVSTSSASLNSTNGLLNVANTSASSSGVLARFQSNSTAGSGLTVLANGNIGIGTTSPANRLEVAAPDNTDIAEFKLGAGQGITIASNGAGQNPKLQFHNSSNTPVMWVSPGGGCCSSSVVGSADNLSLGIPSNNWLGIGFDGAADPTAKVEIDGNATTQDFFKISSDADSGNQGDVLTVKNNGNVGIGLNSPSLGGTSANSARRYLTIKGSTGSGVLQMTSAAADADNVNLGNIEWIDSGSSSSDKRAGYLNIFTSGSVATNRGSMMAFGTRDDGGTAVSERMRINNLGNIGIGTTNVGARVDIRGSTSDNTAAALLVRSLGGTTILYGRNDGNVGIGTTSPQTSLQVAGVISPATNNSYTLGSASYRFTEVYATNGVINTSDRREKKEIYNTDLGLEFINKLRPVSYRWSTGVDDDIHYGLIAQEAEAALIENGKIEKTSIVTYNKEIDRYGVRYSELISPIIKAVQELYSRLMRTEREIASINSSANVAESKISKLEVENEKLKQENEQIKQRLDMIEKALKSK